MDFITKQVSSLQRVFLDGKFDLKEYNTDSALKGERFSYQIAYKSDEKFFAEIIIDSPLSQYISVRSVGNVPSELPVFSEYFWQLAESFMKTAVHTGVNMLLTPVFTPPLDTRIGGERLTVQLVDVKLESGKYSFGFDKFIRWVKLAQKCGIKYFEISHLFSQWGAKYTPKIIADFDGVTEKIFGWETLADSKEYAEFLRAFLPEFINVIRSLKIEKNTFFHISDEPNEEQIESYRKAKSIVTPLLDGFPIIDALSDYSFYESGIIARPIPCTNDIESFIKKGFPHPWTYYCCGQGGKLSNRFFGMPLSATRIIGLQLFKYGIEGFLQWGFNFYNSQFSLRSIDPFAVTDADSAFPSGDSFTVYPGENGAVESVRSEVFYEALQDMRALNLLSNLIGKSSTISLIEKNFGIINFTDYPRGTEYMLKLRKIINDRLDNLNKE